MNSCTLTDAGRLTAAPIIWKVAGPAVLHLICAMVVFTVSMIMVRVIYMRLFTAEYQQVSYERFFGMFKGTKMVRVPKTISKLDNDGEWLAFNMLWVIPTASFALCAIII